MSLRTAWTTSSDLPRFFFLSWKIEKGTPGLHREMCLLVHSVFFSWKLRMWSRRERRWMRTEARMCQDARDSNCIQETQVEIKFPYQPAWKGVISLGDSHWVNVLWKVPECPGRCPWCCLHSTRSCFMHTFPRLYSLTGLPPLDD